MGTKSHWLMKRNRDGSYWITMSTFDEYGPSKNSWSSANVRAITNEEYQQHQAGKPAKDFMTEEKWYWVTKNRDRHSYTAYKYTEAEVRKQLPSWTPISTWATTHEAANESERLNLIKKEPEKYYWVIREGTDYRGTAHKYATSAEVKLHAGTNEVLSNWDTEAKADTEAKRLNGALETKWVLKYKDGREKLSTGSYTQAQADERNKHDQWGPTRWADRRATEAESKIPDRWIKKEPTTAHNEYIKANKILIAHPTSFGQGINLGIKSYNPPHENLIGIGAYDVPKAPGKWVDISMDPWIDKSNDPSNPLLLLL